MAIQQGTVYRYFRVDADHDVSGDTLEISLDRVTWSPTGVTFVPKVSWPARVTAVTTADPPVAGLTAYWWRVLTGPNALALPVGTSPVYGRLTDSPEIPHFAWSVTVGSTE